MVTHRAIVQEAPSGPLTLQAVERSALGATELLVRVEAVALNPGEQKSIDRGTQLSYPYIPGADLAGIVIEVGSSVSNFKVGDKIISLHLSSNNAIGNKSSALQDVAVVPSDLAAHVPQHYSLAQASTLPVTALTVFAGFYEAGWPFPEKESSVTRDEPVLVWGGGSGVGQAAISLLKLAGYTTIITTAAGKREGYLKARGATHVIDYKSADLVARVGKILGGKPLTKAIDAISTEETSAQIVALLSPGASLIYVLPDGSLAKRPDVSSRFVFCGMFHNNSGQHPEHREFGATKLWPYIEYLLSSKVYPLQPHILLQATSEDILEKVVHGFDLVRTGGGDGQKIVIGWPSNS